MEQPHNKTRRRLLVLAAQAVPAGVVATGVSGCAQAPANDRQLVFKTLNEALAELARLTSPQALAPATAWNWAQTLTHLAQSIEFSMLGFPQPKHPLFQRTVGAAAFNVFAWRGRMTHNLAEPIPGAPALDANMGVDAALARLKLAASAFANWAGPLKPHFAYGELSKAEYEQAHAMHLANHFSAFQQA